MKKIKLHVSYLSPVCAGALALVQNDRYDLTFQDRLAANEEELAATIADADAVYIGGDDFYSAAVLKRAKNLKLLSFGGTGYATFIDVAAAKELGIAITNTPGANSKSVAEFSVGLAIDALRKITFANKTENRPSGRELGALKIGLIGYGKINQHIHKILRDGFGADVRFWNRSQVPGGVDLDSVLSESDMIFLAITSNDETRNFIGADKIEKMKDGVILINPARPDLVDEAALVSAIESGKMSAYAVDDRPPPSLMKFGNDKVIATPHMAASTPDAWNKTDMIAFQNIVDFFETGTCKNIVN
jgi:gluconate 2-dehydrogenase